MELAAWIMVLAKPVRSSYATDSKDMMDKALLLIQQAHIIEQKLMRGEKVNTASPYKKTWDCRLMWICGKWHGRRSCNVDPKAKRSAR